METLGERLQAIQKERFVGRATELAGFRNWIGPGGDATPILAVSGAGGIGKSWLLRRMAREAVATGWSLVAADGHNVGARAEDQLVALAGTADLDAAVAALSRPSLLLLIDTMGAMTPLSAEAQQLLRRLPEGSRVLVAGRRRVAALLPGWEPMIVEHVLGGLSAADQYDYLRRRGIQDRALQALIVGRTGGHPLTLSLAADLCQLGVREPFEAPQWGQVVADLVGQLRAWLRPHLGEVVEAAAVLGRFDESALSAVSNQSNAQTILSELSGLSLLRRVDGHFEVHDEVRCAIVEDLRLHAPQRLDTLRERAFDHYRQVETGPSGMRDRTLALRRLHMVGRDLPGLSAYFDATVEGVRVEEGTPSSLAEVAEVQRLTATGLPSEERSADLLAAALAHPKARVRVARDTKGEVVGYAFWVQLCEQSISLFSPGGHIAGVIRVGISELGPRELPSSASNIYYLSNIAIAREDAAALGALAQDLMPLFLDEGAYLALTSDPLYMQALEALGANRLTFPASSGPHEPAPVGYLVDLSRVGYGRWVANLAAGSRPAQLGTEAELGLAVTEAVAHWNEDAYLADSAIAAVAEPGKQVTVRAAAARCLLEEALGREWPWPSPRRHLAEAMATVGIKHLPQPVLPASPPSSAVGGLERRLGPRPTPKPDFPLWIRVLGDFQVRVDGRLVDAGQSVAAQVLKIVAISGRISAEQVIDWVWPQAGEDSARERLSSVLGRLRRAAGRPLIARGAEGLVLANGSQSDLSAFSAAGSAALQALALNDPRAPALGSSALGLYGGVLLPGDLYADWAVAPREKARSLYLRLLDLLAQEAASRGDTARAVSRLEQAITEDPHDESRYLQAALLLAERGWRSRAVETVRRARKMLNSLGLVPGGELAALEGRLSS